MDAVGCALGAGQRLCWLSRFNISVLKICFYYVLRIIWTHRDMSSRDYFDEAEMKVMMTTEPKRYMAQLSRHHNYSDVY